MPRRRPSRPNKASSQGKANVRVYDAVTGLTTEIGGNFSFVVTVVDNGANGVNDHGNFPGS